MAERTFEQAAQDHYRSFIEDIDQGLARLAKARGESVEEEDTDEESEDKVEVEQEDEDSIYEEFDMLSIEKRTLIDVTLGTGGPACGFTLELDTEGDVDSGEYWYQDWFQPRRKFSLSKDEIEKVLDLYRIDPYYYK